MRSDGLPPLSVFLRHQSEFAEVINEILNEHSEDEQRVVEGAVDHVISTITTLEAALAVTSIIDVILQVGLAVTTANVEDYTDEERTIAFYEYVRLILGGVLARDWTRWLYDEEG